MWNIKCSTKHRVSPLALSYNSPRVSSDKGQKFSADEFVTAFDDKLEGSDMDGI